MFQSWESYFYPETIDESGNGVLKNLLNIKDADELKEIEANFAYPKMITWLLKPLMNDFSYEHLKAIHFHIFQDIYPWAGQERQVGMSKAGHAYYPPGEILTQAANTQFQMLEKENFLQGLDRYTFVEKLAEFWGEINVVHSFREGNTRTQSVFFSQLAQAAGHPFNLVKLSKEPLRTQFVQARFHSQATGSNRELASVLDQVVFPNATRDKQRPKTLSELAGYIVADAQNKARTVKSNPSQSKLGKTHNR
ncbi:MAG: Fic family protein [Arcanobacterium sp.]|nr:Fic family protein [Arcanobacterium sp.]